MTKEARYARAWDAFEAAAGDRLQSVIALGSTSREIAAALAATNDPLASLMAEVAKWDAPAPRGSASRQNALRELARTGDEDAFDEIYG